MNTKPDIESLLNSISGVVYRVDLTASPEGRIVFVSNKIEELCGYTSNDFLSGAIKWFDLVVKEDIPIIYGVVRHVTQSESYKIEYRIQDKAGNIRWVLNQGYTTVGNEKPLWSDGVMLDLTTTKAQEQELLSNKNALNNLVESLDDIIYEIDTNGHFKDYYTKNWRSLILPPAAFLNKTITGAFSDDPFHAELLNNAYQRAITQKESVAVEYSVTNENSVQWFRAKFRPLSERGAASAILIVTNITKQKDAEKALEHSEQFLRWTSETAKIGGWQIDILKETIFWSDEACRIREIEQSGEQKLDQIYSFYPVEVQPIIKKTNDEGIQKGIPWNLELPFITAKGNKKWIRDIGIPEMTDGKCQKIYGVIQDITLVKNAELTIQKHEEQLELAIQGGNLGIWNWNIVTGDIVFDHRWTILLGYSLEETEPHFSTWEKLLHPDDVSYVTDVLQDHLNEKTEYYESEHRLKHKEGHWVWVLNKGKVIERSDSGKPLRASGTYFDITERKKIELLNFNLKVELEEFKSAVNASSIVSITDLKGVIKYVNHKFVDISKYNRDELIGQKHNIINSGHHPKAFWKEMWQTIRQGKVWRNEVKNIRKDGTYYWVDTFIIPLRNSENQLTDYLSIRNDISEKKENEIRLKEALLRAEESDRLKSAFLANISHEIRTPMNAIMGFAELLDKPNLTENKRSEFINLIHSRSRDLLNIINGILDISKIEAGHVSSMRVEGNLTELLDRLLETFNADTIHLQKKNFLIKIKNELGTSESYLLADFNKLQQVLMNLLTNATKFTQEGFIELQCRLLNSQELLFSVRDTGIGIPSHQLDKIFKPFHQATDTTHLQYGGSGLGLAICKGLIELCGGHIWAESEVGKGSIFYFTIPYQPINNKNSTNF